MYSISNPEKYLNRKLEKSKRTPLLESVLIPLFDADFSQQEGSISTCVNSINLRLKFGVDKNCKDGIRKVNLLTLKKGTEEFSLTNFFKQGVTIYFDASNTNPNDFRTGFIPDENKVFIGFSINSPLGILALTHELGHANMMEVNGKEYIEKIFASKNALSKGWASKEKEKPAANELLDERTAWSFALKKLRPFLRDLNITDEVLKNVIHDIKLGGYSRSLRASTDRFDEELDD